MINSRWFVLHTWSTGVEFTSCKNPLDFHIMHMQTNQVQPLNVEARLPLYNILGSRVVPIEQEPSSTQTYSNNEPYAKVMAINAPYHPPSSAYPTIPAASTNPPPLHAPHMPTQQLHEQQPNGQNYMYALPPLESAKGQQTARSCFCIYWPIWLVIAVLIIIGLGVGLGVGLSKKTCKTSSPTLYPECEANSTPCPTSTPFYFCLAGPSTGNCSNYLTSSPFPTTNCTRQCLSSWFLPPPPSPPPAPSSLGRKLMRKLLKGSSGSGSGSSSGSSSKC